MFKLLNYTKYKILNTFNICDKTILIAVSFLIVIGIMAVFSASVPRCIAAQINILHYLFQHIIWVFLGFSGLIFLANVDYKKLKAYTFPLAIIVITLLLVVQFTSLGVTINGAKRWINLGFQFQPSEFAKLAVIMLSARFFTIKKEFQKENLVKYLLSILVIIGLIFKQPNLSMSLILFATAFSMFICGSKNLKWLLWIIIPIILTGLAFSFKIINLSDFIEPYQLERIFTYKNPEADLQGSGYNVFHSLIAISSGGIVGQGYGASKEKMGWLPECHTDFIFSVIGEEAGFFGSLLIIGLFWTFFSRSLYIAYRCEDIYGKLLAFGIGFSITLQAFINISVTCALLPATGVTLPFISYGGTSLMVTLWMIGILLNISVKKLKYNNICKLKQRSY